MKAGAWGLALGLAVWAALAAGAAGARDLVVIAINREYDQLADVDAEIGLRRIRAAAEDAGAEVEMIEDATAFELHSFFAGQRGRMEAADRLSVLLVGHVVSKNGSNWLLGRDAERETDPFQVGAEGLPVDPILDILATKPGASTLMVASAIRRGEGGPGLGTRFAAGTVAQGVTVATGPADRLGRLLAEDVLPARRPVGRAIRDLDLSGEGFLPIWMPAARSPAPATGTETASGAFAADRAAFQAAQEDDTVAAYEAYIRRFPDGAFRTVADLRLAALRQSPEDQARTAEQGLELDRDARAEVQRNLSILGHDPRGIDGIFGQGTRTAIRSWQRAEGLEATGYLTGNQVIRLQEAAVRRQAALEAEAKQRQDEADRQDTQYWRDAGSGSSEAGLRRYLERYPEDGLYTDIARTELARIENARAATARGEDRRDWQAARRADTMAGYADYLARQPDGAFRDDAEARMAELRGIEDRADQVDQARAQESQVVGNSITRQLVERRLAQLGLDPGRVDGTFDDATRRAIRRYQRARDLPATGFVSQATLVRMLAGN